MKLLLVEDEEMLSMIIAKGLRKLGYAVDTVFDGEEAMFSYEVNHYDLIILDLNLPEKDGIDVLREIRGRDHDTKVLVLSARSKVQERVMGLDVGANDYLVKPFDFIELEARVRNLLRRSFVQSPVTMKCGNLCIDTASKKTYWMGELLELTKKEYSILEYLMINMNRVVSAEQIIEHVWDSEVDPFSSALRYHIHILKKKLNKVSHLELIKTIRGQGYIIEEGNDEITS